MRLVILVALILSGCSKPAPDHMVLLCECFTQAAYEAVKARKTLPAPPAPAACCTECRGTGKVRSGDGHAWVDCPCPETCKCKKK